MSHDCFRIRLMVVWVLVLFYGCSRSSNTHPAMIGGSSMEPTLAGPRVIGICKSCETPFSFSDELARKVAVLQCTRCGKLLEPLDSRGSIPGKAVPGQSVEIEQINYNTKLRRGELIVFEDALANSTQGAPSQLQQSSRQIKRLIGFPNEMVRISDGDLFIDGYRFEKSPEDFYRTAILVSGWPEAIDFIRHGSDPNSVVVYQSTSLWPRRSAEPIRHSSPILDELESNPDEPFEFTSVHDIGVVIDLDIHSVVGSDIAIGIWTRGFLRSVQLKFDKTHLLSVPGGHLRDNFGASLCFSPQQMVARVTPKRLLVAAVDGRMIVALVDREGQVVGSCAWDLFECLDASNRFAEANIAAERPIAISVRDAAPHVTSVKVVRDIHYRGPQGESEFALPLVNAVHVLGDNVSISSDSRSDLSAGIDRRLITGRVVAVLP